MIERASDALSIITISIDLIMQHMQPNPYLVSIAENELSWIYNTLTEGYFSVQSRHLSQYMDILKNPLAAHPSFDPFLSKMLLGGFVLDADTDVKTLVSNKFSAQLRPWEYRAMILPTYQCNLRCWYCIQRHENTNMTPTMLTWVSHHIERRLRDIPDIQHFRLSWFGGEPLLQFEKVAYITKQCKDLASSMKKTFSCDITTNSTLLTPNRINELNLAGVDSYQITIDGDKESHDKVKCLHNASAFDKVIDNINCICQVSNCILRFNYTKGNLDPELLVGQLDRKVSKEVRTNIRFLIYKVWQEKDTPELQQKVAALFLLAQDAGFNPYYATTGLCYADQAHFDCFYPNGVIGKCDNHLLVEENTRFDSDGNLIRKSHPKLATPLLEQLGDGDCRECVYLPICWGPCYSKRKAMYQHHQKIRCPYTDKHKIFSKYILDKIYHRI